MQVFEETGLDIGGRFAEEDCVEIWTKSGTSQKRTKLFFVPGIDTSTEFAPQARKVGASESTAIVHETVPPSSRSPRPVITQDRC